MLARLVGSQGHDGAWSPNGGTGIDLCGAWTRTGDDWSVYRGLLADVKTRFDAAGITIPYPQRDVHVHGAGV